MCEYVRFGIQVCAGTVDFLALLDVILLRIVVVKEDGEPLVTTTSTLSTKAYSTKADRVIQIIKNLIIPICATKSLSNRLFRKTFE